MTSESIALVRKFWQLFSDQKWEDAKALLASDVVEWGQKTFANSYFEIRAGKIARIEEYWAEPHAAPDWRKKWVELY